jgi:hypothetical protein
MKFDVPINFEVYADSEEDAIFDLQKFLRAAIIEFGLENVIVEHELFEFLPEYCVEQDSTEPSSSGCHCK